MTRHSSLIAVVGLIAVGCASGPPFIDQMQPEAVSMAVRRAQFEFNCPAATGEIISRETVQPLAFGGPLRAEYTIGVVGCQRRATFVVICSQNGNQCFAGGARY